ncbi:hypothetical protein C8Q77DRAFT_762124 [Trametes polyzona]|nr:hypothetical protein C8Q77DRAFT_762124 [Trametes polyzona]
MATSNLTVAAPPKPLQCAPVNLTWTGGTPPYDLAVTSFNRVYVEFSSLPSTSAVWTINITAGTALQLIVADSSEIRRSAISDTFFVDGSADGSCLPTPEPEERAGMSKGAIAGIVVATAFVSVVVSMLVWTRRRRRRGGAQVVDLVASPTISTFPESQASMRIGQDNVHKGDEESAPGIVPVASSSVYQHSTLPQVRDVGTHGGAKREPATSASRTPTSPKGLSEQDVRRGIHSAVYEPLRNHAEGQAPTYEEDGGVRLAGGPMDGHGSNQDDDAPSTLPPPYRLY